MSINAITPNSIQNNTMVQEPVKSPVDSLKNNTVMSPALSNRLSGGVNVANPTPVVGDAPIVENKLENAPSEDTVEISTDKKGKGKKTAFRF